jgi:hypothetical protein
MLVDREIVLAPIEQVAVAAEHQERQPSSVDGPPRMTLPTAESSPV